jgi:hypothetical protein
MLGQRPLGARNDDSGLAESDRPRRSRAGIENKDEISRHVDFPKPAALTS